MKRLPKVGERVLIHNAYELELEPAAIVVSVDTNPAPSGGPGGGGLSIGGGVLVTVEVTPLKPKKHERTLSIHWVEGYQGYEHPKDET